MGKSRPRLAIAAILVVALVAATAATAASAAIGEAWTPPAATFDVQQVVNHPFHMEDGTQLMGSLYYPVDRGTQRRAAGQFPVIVTMTPYGMWDGNSESPKEGADHRVMEYFASHGYIGVEVDTRGAARSEGSFTPWSRQESLDYLEVIDEVAHRLDGSNGVVGLAGMSYRGLNQLLVAGMLEQGTPVKAIAPHSAGASIYEDVFFGGGIPGAFWYAYGGIEGISEVPPPDQLLAEGGADPAHLARLARDRADTALYLSELYTNTSSGGYMAHRDQWWDQREPIHGAGVIVAAGVPVLLTSSGTDPFTRGSLRMYAALQNVAHGRDPWAPMDPRLKPDPRYQLVFSNDYDDGEDAYWVGYSLQWYDHWLKGIDNGVGEAGATLHLGVYGGDGGWINVPHSAYPVTLENTPYYLASGGALSTQAEAPGSSETLAWQPGESLVFTSAALPDGAMLVGPVSATIHATSTTPEVELIATLNVVAPDGTATTVHNGLEADGALIGSARALDVDRTWSDREGRAVYPFHPFSSTAARPVPVGEVVRYDLALQPRVLDVPPGHRLQLVLESQSPVLYPTTPQLRGLAGGEYEVQIGGDHASFVHLPIFPRGTFPTTGDPTQVGLGG